MKAPTCRYNVVLGTPLHRELGVNLGSVQMGSEGPYPSRRFAGVKGELIAARRCCAAASARTGLLPRSRSPAKSGPVEVKQPSRIGRFPEQICTATG